MKECEGAGAKVEPTFIDVLEHIGSGGVTVDRSVFEKLNSQRQEHARAYAGRDDRRTTRDSGGGDVRARKP